MKLIILFILLLIYIYSNYGNKIELFQSGLKYENYGPLKTNHRIVRILESMKYIKNYNNILYKELLNIVNIILASYYKTINNDVDINDISFYKDKLSDIYEEIALNLPYKYYDRLSSHFEQLNKEFDKKIDLIKIKSSKYPIKISLMNYKS